MGFTTYSDLKSSILNFLGRPNDPLLPVDDLIHLFEIDAGRRLRTHFQETHSDLTTIAGTDTYAVPTGFMAPREVRITSTTPRRVLDYMAPAELDDTYVFGLTEQPINYTIEGTNIRFGPIPDAVYTIRVEYWAAIAPLFNGTFSASAVDVVAGGTAYAVNNELTASGGTQTATTKITVDTIAGNSYHVSAEALVDASSGYTVDDILTVVGGTSSATAKIVVDTIVRDDAFHADTETIVTGGTGYIVLDTLTVNGGTQTTFAQIIVDTVDGSGVILTCHISQNGVYSIHPGNSVSVTGGAGTGARFNLTWVEDATAGTILSAHVFEPGNYSVKPTNPVSVTGGSGTTGTFNLTWVQDTIAGTILTAHISTPGVYTVLPANPVSVTGGAGTLATFNLTFTENGTPNWLQTNYPDAYLFGSLAEAELFLGADSSSDRFGIFVQRRDAIYQGIILADHKYRMGGAPLVMKTDTGNP